MAEDAKVVSIAERRGRAYMTYLIEQYQDAHPDEDASLVEPHLVAAWAIKKGLYKKPPVLPEDRLRRELSRFLKTEYTTDPQGREIRKHHAVVYTVQTPEGTKRRAKWYEIYHAPSDAMQAALQLRRQMAFRDVVQLSLDFDSYNDNNLVGASLEAMDFDFNKDLAEAKLPTTYPSDPPAETDDDDFDDEIN
jgi:hypothetical protein